MSKRVKKALVHYFTDDVQGHRRLRKPPVGVEVAEAAPRFCLSLSLTYRGGARYCCSAPACLFSPLWGRLRELLSSQGLTVEHPIRVFLRAVYERGALFAANPGDPNPIYQPLDEARTSEHVVDELDGWDPIR